MKAILRFSQKVTVHGRYLVEMEVHEVPTDKYPTGFKYGLVCIDLHTKKKVLFDNHYPKGPHIHLDAKEFVYTYTDLPQLVDDFKAAVLNHLGVAI